MSIYEALNKLVDRLSRELSIKQYNARHVRLLLSRNFSSGMLIDALTDKAIYAKLRAAVKLDQNRL